MCVWADGAISGLWEGEGGASPPGRGRGHAGTWGCGDGVREAARDGEQGKEDCSGMEFGRARCPTVARGVWLRAQAVFRPSCKRVWGAHRARVQTTAATMRRRSVAGEGEGMRRLSWPFSSGDGVRLWRRWPAREAPIAVVGGSTGRAKGKPKDPKGDQTLIVVRARPTAHAGLGGLIGTLERRAQKQYWRCVLYIPIWVPILAYVNLCFVSCVCVSGSDGCLA